MNHPHPTIRFHIFHVSPDAWNQKAQSVWERKKQIEQRGGTTLLLSTRHPSVNFDQDIPLAIPGGMPGAHAFFTILENIIRNAAKYSYHLDPEGKGPDLHIVIEFRDQKIKSEAPNTTNPGNAPDNDPQEELEHESIDTPYGPFPAIRVRIYDSVSTMEQKELDRINEMLQKPLLDERTGSVRRDAWGLAEIVIAAGFLQQRDILHIGSGGERITGEKELGPENIVRAVESPLGTLGYEFFMRLPIKMEVWDLTENGVANRFFSQKEHQGILYTGKTQKGETTSSPKPARLGGFFLAFLPAEKFPEALFQATGTLKQDNEERQISIAIERMPTRIILLFPPKVKEVQLPTWLSRRLLIGTYQNSTGQLTITIGKHRYPSGGSTWDHARFLQWLYVRWIEHLIHPRQEQEQESQKGPLALIRWGSVFQESEPRTSLNRYDVPTLPPLMRDSAQQIDRQRELGDQSPGQWVLQTDGTISTEAPSSNPRVEVVCTRHDIDASLRYGHLSSPRTVNFVLSGSFPWFSSLLHSPSGHNELPFHLAEAASVRIGIMDERFQEWNMKDERWLRNAVAHVFPVFLNEPGTHGQPSPGLVKIFWKLQVQGDTDTAKTTGYKIQIEKIQHLDDSDLRVSNIKDFLDSVDSLDLLILHLGIFEKAGIRERENLEKIVDSIKQQGIPFVIFTSGRGQPENLPDGVKFLPYAALQSTFHSVSLDKVSLVRTLFSLVRR